MKKIFILFCVLAMSIGVFAQSAVVSSGGDFSGTNSSISYSVGQVGYNAYDGSIQFNEGVQQPYEIYEITDNDPISDEITFNLRSNLESEEVASSISLSAYPNPTDDFLNLVVDGDDLGAMKCTVYDVSGRMISERSIFVGETRLDMGGLPPATYFVRVIEGNKLLRTFKVVKN